MKDKEQSVKGITKHRKKCEPNNEGKGAQQRKTGSSLLASSMPSTNTGNFWLLD